MSTCPFCNRDPAPDAAEPTSSTSTIGEGNRPTGLVLRAWRGIQWLFPATLLVLMPKCPLCVAAYVAFFTGIGITISAARWIQILMLVLCWTALVYLAIRYWRRRSKPRGFPETCSA
jgi:hypothetical protein